MQYEKSGTLGTTKPFTNLLTSTKRKHPDTDKGTGM
jgi:hypothetical protein